VPAGTHELLHEHVRILGRDDWAAIARSRDVDGRDHARATRIALRLALSHAVAGAVDPKAWSFEATSYGKPLIKTPVTGLHFCISHIDTLSLIAVSRGAPVGIDLEPIGREVDDKIVDAFCSRRERRQLRRLPDSERRRAFARLWTLKEAYAKLTGTGLAADFRSLEFEVGQDRQLAASETSHTFGEACFESWLAEAPSGLCQVSVAVGFDSAAQGKGELVCFAVDNAAGVNTKAHSLELGRGCEARVSLC
jgi:4'-phosphopantetheinyl transferase